MEENIKKTRKPDRRVARTKKAIRNALITLMSKKDFDCITVKEVAELADVNRKTIYNYYSSINEILDDIENIVISSYETSLKNMECPYDYTSTDHVFKQLTNVVNTNYELYSSLFKLPLHIGFITKLVMCLKEKVQETLNKGDRFKDPSKVDMVSSYLVAGIVAAYHYWFLGPKQVSLNDYSQEVSHLVVDSLTSFLK